MKEEYEVKFLNIDIAAMEKKLAAIGAKKQFDRIFRWRNFDYPDFRLDQACTWFKVRDEGDKVIMAYKHRLGAKSHEGKHDDKGMEEYTIEVSDFEEACTILKKIGLVQKFHEEKRRIKYFLDGINFDIDTQPGIPPFLEIEADSWDRVEKGIKLLGLDPKDKRIFSAYQIYKMNGIEMMDYKEFSFKKGLVKR